MQPSWSSSGRNAGLRLNQFVTISPIGKGAYGKVFLVRNIEDGGLYAMKILNKRKIESPKQEKHVKTERDVLVEMNRSPFLIGFYGSFQCAKRLYFILEYCPGGELFYRFCKCRRFDEGTARFYAAQILLALDHLHRKNIIYRDLKLENVLIGADGYVKVTDFGLSRTNVLAEEALSLVGTFEYLAPEMLTKTGYGKAIDWWTFGSLLYEMVVGYAPFYVKGSSRREMLERIRNGTPTYPSRLSPNLKSLVQALLEKDPTRRLGAAGSDEVRAHEWFKGIDFDDVLNKRLPPPFVPIVDQSFGLQNFDKEFRDMSLRSPETAERACTNFEGFTWEEQAAVEASSPMDVERETESAQRIALKSVNFDPIEEE